MDLVSRRPPPGGPGGDSAWRGEGSDVQGVPAVGVGGQSPDAAGSSIRPPQRGPGGFGSGSGRDHAAPAFHEVPFLTIIAFHLSPAALNFLPAVFDCRQNLITLCDSCARRLRGVQPHMNENALITNLRRYASVSE